MIAFVVNFLQQTLIPLGGWGVFGALFFQEILAFIPSSLVMLASGFILLPMGPLTASFFSTLFFTIALPTAAGGTLGSLLVYWLIRQYGETAINRFGRYLGVSWSDIERINKRLSGTYLDEIIIFAMRAIPIVPNSLPTAICGLIRMPLYKYLPLTFFGVMIRALILGFIGSRVGVLYVEYASYFERYTLVGTFVILSACVGFFYLRKEKKSLS